MNGPSSFTIERQDPLLMVTLNGQWDIGADRAYLRALAEQFEGMRGKPWGVVVNMLNWDMQNDEARLKSSVADVFLDRTDQVAECWIVRDNDQAKPLLKYMQRATNIRFKRCRNPEDAIAWMKLLGL